MNMLLDTRLGKLCLISLLVLTNIRCSFHPLFFCVFVGGLYGKDADERRSKGAKKRKRSTYCFFCAPEILHPISGFEGGYPDFSAM